MDRSITWSAVSANWMIVSSPTGMYFAGHWLSWGCYLWYMIQQCSQLCIILSSDVASAESDEYDVQYFLQLNKLINSFTFI